VRIGLEFGALQNRNRATAVLLARYDGTRAMNAGAALRRTQGMIA